MKKLKAILIGAGGRGRIYTNLMADDVNLKEKYEVVAVAEPKETFRTFIKEKHNLPDEMCFESWEPLLDLPKIADVAIIATMDQDHYAPTMKAIEKGYDLLLEKPLSNKVEECVEMANAAKKKGVKTLVCHVARYRPVFAKAREMIIEGKIGRVISIHHCENVGYYRQAQSFVRGNWGNSRRSSPMILQKCCHDMDLMQWMIGQECKSVQSFGSLSYFKRENAPEGSPERCGRSCPAFDSCIYNVEKMYINAKGNLVREKVANKKNPTNEDVIEGLKTSQYGQCIFKCDNDVVDHQVVNLEFADGALASFNMCAFNKEGRYMRIMGTEGELCVDVEQQLLEHYSFDTKETKKIDITSITSVASDSHGGGDKGILINLYKYLAEGMDSAELSEMAISAKNHIITFAAEKSRLERKIIDIKEYQEELGLIVE